MLKQGLIKDTVNKSTFSEQCYYTFGHDHNLAEFGQLSLNDSRLSGDSAQHPVAAAHATQMTSVPLGSAGSGGSGGGIWGVGMTSQQQPSAAEIWTGGQTSGSTTTYGPIYNPSAPPPSANYFMGSGGVYAGTAPPPASSHSGSGSHRSNRLMLAASGSGSESASDGRSSSVMGSDKSSLLRNNQLRPGAGTLFT